MLEFIALVGLLALWGASLYLLRKRWLEAERKAGEAASQVERLTKALDKRDGTARATIKGQLAEQIAPLLPGFPFVPSDFRFLGQPIDFIVYVGLTEAKEGLGGITEVVLGDIKQGSARLSPHQRMIKEAVEQGRVRWETIHVGRDFKIRRTQ